MANPVVRSPRRGRLVVSVLLSGLLAGAAGWCALWLYARVQAERNLDAWIAAERRVGRLWTCADRRFDGFPIRIGLSCVAPTFTDADDAAANGGLAALRAEAALDGTGTSGAVTLDLIGPLRIGQAAGQPSLVVSWSKAGATLDGVAPGTFARGLIEAAGIQVVAAGSPTIRLDRGRIDLRPAGRANPPAADLAVDLVNLRDPDLDAFVGTPDPITISGTGTVTHLPAWGAALPALLDAWRTADGRLDVTRLTVAKGGFGMSGTVRLRLDPSHRIEGRFDGAFRGLEPLAARFGIPVGAVKLGGLLSGLLVGKKGLDEGAQLNLPLVARDGRLFLGPAKTAVVVPPLY